MRRAAFPKAADSRTFASATTPAEIAEVFKDLLFGHSLVLQDSSHVPSDRPEQIAPEIVRHLLRVFEGYVKPRAGGTAGAWGCPEAPFEAYCRQSFWPSVQSPSIHT